MTLEAMDVVWTAITVLLILNLVVSIRVLVSQSYTWGQKFAQIALTWVIPLRRACGAAKRERYAARNGLWHS
jgi:TRAP-type C4-dicarboxylate transport system permease small subunit